jgi:DNA polymerase II large subunit
METLKETHCEKAALPYREIDIDLMKVYEMTRERLGFSSDDIKGVEGLMSSSKIPERLEKGFLRAKHGVFIFKDGTSRFDATDMPLTHFIPRDIGTSVERARALGYEKDYLGNPLERDDQIVPLMLQDIILADSGARYLAKVANFIDDMLISLYGLEPFYKIAVKEDLIGHLVIGLSPHTSAGVIGRIIGFTKSNVGYAHPFYQTAKRRNCDGDEDAVMLLMDGFLNFSKKFLSSNRGGTMDAPLVLSITLNPKEVDDESHDMEMLGDRHYPLEFYEAAEAITMPGDVKLKRVKNVLETDDAYGEIPFTHPMSSISLGPTRTKYVQLKSIPEKIAAQVNVMSKIRALDMKDAMEKLILSHFIPDIYGNLRKFSRQSMRCKKCNKIYRRVPLSGKCMKCGSELLLTIYQGTIEKYLEIAKKIALDYGLPFYMVQRLGLVEKEIESVFNSKSRQKGIGDFM